MTVTILPLETFDLVAYEKDPDRLVHQDGRVAKSSRLLEGLDNIPILAVMWEGAVPKPGTKVLVEMYALDDTDPLQLRLKSKKRLLQQDTWVATDGHFYAWKNYGEPPYSREAQEASPFFVQWVEGMYHETWTECDGKFGGPSSPSQIYHDQESIKKIPKSGAVSNWKTVLQNDPNATIGLSNMMWFFGCDTNHALALKIQAGRVPKPFIDENIPYKKNKSRRWSLQVVAQFQDEMTPWARGCQ